MRRRTGVIGTVVLASWLAGCGTGPVVGVLLPQTGAASTYGESIESGIRLAINDGRVNNELPADFQVVWADTASEPDRAVAELGRLATEQHLHLVIGGATSAEAMAVIPLLEELDVICLSPSASAPGLAARSRLFFRIYPSDELEGHTAAKFLVDRMDQKRVILYAGNSQYTQGIEPEFEKQYQDTLGGRIVARVDLTNPDWHAESQRLLRANQGVSVFVIGYAEEILEALREVRATSPETRFVTTSAFYSTTVIREAGVLAEGILFPLPPYDRTSEKEPVQSFVARYMETYQRAPDVFAAHGYDAMRFAIAVMRIAKPPVTQELRRAMQFGVPDFMGVTGPILFDDYGDVKHYPKMFIVDDGQVVSYQRYLKGERARILRQVQDLLTDSG